MYTLLIKREIHPFKFYKHPIGMAVFNNPTHPPKFRAGYGTAKKARQVAGTMYYRAKYHKYQTPGMKEAMKIYGDYLKSKD
jgi:hypothetical protein